MLLRSLQNAEILLDFGCGTGVWLRYFLQINPNLQYQVFDIDKRAETLARAIAPERLADSASRFDVIVLFAILELLTEEEQEEILRSIVEKLQPSGKILVQYNIYNRLSPRWIALAFAGMGRARRYHSDQRYGRSYLTMQQAEAIFTRSGLTITDRATGLLHHKIPKIMEGILRWFLRAPRFHSQIYYVLKYQE